MLWDEFYFHHKRGLGRWETFGHPLDTLSVLLVYGLALLTPPEGTWLTVYAACAFGSCLFVAKDEWVHQAACEGTENWVHAILFMLHPVVFLSLYLLWVHPPKHLIFGLIGWKPLLWGQVFVLVGFACYQFFYWWPRSRKEIQNV